MGGYALMQSIMFIKSTEDGPIDRIVNLDLLSTAHDAGSEEGHEGEIGTVLLLQGARVNMGMKFSDFLSQVEKLIADNYRVAHESSAAWHKKRMEDTEAIMRSVMHEHVK